MSQRRYVELLEAFASRRVAVIGDFLLDQYILGTTARVSREAPIVVVDYQGAVNHPGGAANAAQNIAALGGTAVAVGVVGSDREGEALASLLRERNVDATHLLADPSAATSSKLRILAGEMNAQKQQVARVDRSHRVAPSKALRSRLEAAVDGAVAGCDAVLLSDYGMGLVPGDLSRRAIESCRARSIPVVVDSRRRLFEFKGATVATPNEVEAMEALGLESEDDLARDGTLRRRVAESGIGAFIVTRGSQGMIVCDGETTYETIGVVGSREATDVTGAGDTVSSVVALSLASGARLAEAARMATFAAAVVVMKRGTATASPPEVRAMIEAHAGV